MCVLAVEGGADRLRWRRAAVGSVDIGLGLVRQCGMATGACWAWGVEADQWGGPLPRLGAGFEGLDDDHTPAAARTGVPLGVFVTIFGAVCFAARRGRGGYAEQLAGQCNVVNPIGIGEQTVVTDAMEPAG